MLRATNSKAPQSTTTPPAIFEPLLKQTLGDLLQDQAFKNIMCSKTRPVSLGKLLAEVKGEPTKPYTSLEPPPCRAEVQPVSGLGIFHVALDLGTTYSTCVWSQTPPPDWLKYIDFLPSEVPNTRIITYGYNSKYLGDDVINPNASGIGCRKNYSNSKQRGRTWRHGDPLPTGKPSENRRKALRVNIRGKEHLSCPDSGSSENIMTEHFAHDARLTIRRNFKDLKKFQLGSGKYVRSVGRVFARVQIPGISLAKKKRSFYVLPDCPVPLVMGLPFLKEAEIMSRNRHVLESCLADWSQISTLLWIGSPRNRMGCSLAGHELSGVADTGSDLNLMSLECAKREGFNIDRRKEARRRIKVGDGSEMETIGQVYIYDIAFDWRQPEIQSPEAISPNSLNSSPAQSIPTTEPSLDDSNYEIFHVLPGLLTDLIFGRDFLDSTDAFNLCPELLTTSRYSDKHHINELNVLIDCGKPQFHSRRWWRKRQIATTSDYKEQHDNERHAEYGRRLRREDEIALLPQGEQLQARRAEEGKARGWDQLHVNCVYCNLT